MKKFNTSPISGTQELLPSLQAEFNRLKSGIAAAFAHHGFQNIETPVIERTEVLLAKAGGDTEKQIYKVIKTAETADDADQALRFDHTVPLARYTVEHMNDLAFPFKVTQIGRNFRGERAQKGRFREFYQCDVDVIGWGTLPIAYDADVLAALAEAIKVLPLPGDFYYRISNRKILTGLLESYNLEHLSAEIFDIIDHAEKVPAEVTREHLEELKIGSEYVEKILAFMEIRGSRAEAIPKLEAFNLPNEKFNQGIKELDECLYLLEEVYGLGNAFADLKIIRGLDYYTGMVYETLVEGYEKVGSICSGGRYENLASNYTDQSLPGVGGSIGLTRLFYILQECGAVKSSDLKPIDICICPISAAELPFSEQLAQKLRGEGKIVDVVLTDKKLGDKLKYAAKIATSAIVIGEDEVKTGKYELKSFV